MHTFFAQCEATPFWLLFFSNESETFRAISLEILQLHIEIFFRIIAKSNFDFIPITVDHI